MKLAEYSITVCKSPLTFGLVLIATVKGKHVSQTRIKLSIRGEKSLRNSKFLVCVFVTWKNTSVSSCHLLQTGCNRPLIAPYLDFVKNIGIITLLFYEKTTDLVCNLGLFLNIKAT